MQAKIFKQFKERSRKRIDGLFALCLFLSLSLISFSMAGCGGSGGGGGGGYVPQSGDGTVNPALFSGWEMTNGPFSGIVSSFAVDSTMSQKIYAAVENGGLFRSENGGRNWTRIEGGMENLSISSVAVAGDNQTIYVGTRGDGIYESGDGGLTWAEVNNGLPKDPATGGKQYYWINEIQVDQNNAQMAYAIMGTRYHLYKTADGGNSWAKIEGLPEIQPGWPDQVTALAIHPNNPLWLYVGTYKNFLWKSEDGGITWSSKRGNVPSYIVHVKCIGLDIDQDVVWVGTADYGLYKTGDDGDYWQFVQIGPNTVLENWDASALAMDPVDKSTMYAYVENVYPSPLEDAGIYQTFDGGEQWEKVPFCHCPDGYRPVWKVTVAPSDSNVVYVVTQGKGLFITNDVMSVDDVGDWAPIDNGLVDLQVLAIMLNGLNNKIVYAGTEDGVFKTTDGGLTWERKGLAGKSVFALVSDPYDEDIIYVATEDGVYKTTNGGDSWSNPGGYWFYCLAIGNFQNRNVIYGGDAFGMGIYRAMDDGSTPWDEVTWEKKNSGLSDDEKYVNCLAIDPSDSLIVYAGTGYRRMPGPETAGKVIKTIDGGDTWPQKWSIGEPVYSLSIDPFNPQILYAGTYVGFYASSNGGDTWEFRDGGLGQRYVRSIAIDPMDSNKVCAGTYDDGVFASIDGGQHWTQIDQGLTGDLNRRIISLAMDLRDMDNPVAYAGTGCGVFKAYK
jgi:photosystem II stability/assembly factor-like uncharacterized protein